VCTYIFMYVCIRCMSTGFSFWCVYSTRTSWQIWIHTIHCRERIQWGIFISPFSYIYKYIYAYLNSCAYTYIHACMCIYVPDCFEFIQSTVANAFNEVYIYFYMYMYIYTYTYVYIYIHLNEIFKSRENIQWSIFICICLITLGSLGS
jgi:hypothetical protein